LRIGAEDGLPERLPLPAIRLAQQQQKGQRQLAFFHVRAQRLAGLPFLAEQVHAIIINLIGHAQIDTEFTQRLDPRHRRFVQGGAELATDRKQRSRLHLDDFQVLLDGEIELEPRLVLEDFTRTDRIGGAADEPADFGGRIAGRQDQRVCEQTVAQQHADVVAPTGIGRGRAVT